MTHTPLEVVSAAMDKARVGERQSPGESAFELPIDWVRRPVEG